MWRLIDRKGGEDLIQLLVFTDALDQLTKANSVYWYGQVFVDGGFSHFEKGIEILH